MGEIKTMTLSSHPNSLYHQGNNSALADGTRGTDRRANQVPADYKRKADKADAKWCGTAPHERPGPVRKFLDTLPDVEPLCWGAYGEVSEGVRRLVKSLALEMAKDAERCADFNCTGYKQAQGVIAWHFTRHWGRTSVITAAQVKIHQLQCVGGSPQAKRKAHRKWSVLPGGLGSAYWLHRRSARDGGEYAGRGFGGFAS